MNGSVRLLGAVASLALLVVSRTCIGATSASTTSVASDAGPAALTVILQDYNTEASRRLGGLEPDFNQARPSDVPPIVYLDYDKIATWFGLADGPATVETAIGDYLAAKTGHRYDTTTLAALAAAMNSLDVEGIATRRNANGACIVVPQFPGISFHTAYAATFRVGQTDLLAGKAIAIDLPTKAFADFVNAHESWHCLDIRYIRDSGDGLEGAVKRNRTEMFADVGGAIEAVRDGADLALIEKLAALHGTWTFVVGPALARTPADSDKHFDGVTYATEDGLFALKPEVERIGIEAFRKLSRERLRALDYDITDAHCLTYEKAEALQGYFQTGNARGAAMTLIERLKAIAAESIRDATPEELDVRAAQTVRDTKRSAADGQAAERSMLQQLLGRAQQLGDANSFPNQLEARQELTDRLRDQLDSESDSAAELGTEAQLNLLLYVDPRLVPRKEVAKPPVFGEIPRASHAQ